MRKKPAQLYNVSLYRWVYRSRPTWLGVACLCLFLVIAPLSMASEHESAVKDDEENLSKNTESFSEGEEEVELTKTVDEDIETSNIKKELEMEVAPVYKSLPTTDSATKTEDTISDSTLENSIPTSTETMDGDINDIQDIALKDTKKIIDDSTKSTGTTSTSSAYLAGVDDKLITSDVTKDETYVEESGEVSKPEGFPVDKSPPLTYATTSTSTEKITTSDGSDTVVSQQNIDTVRDTDSEAPKSDTVKADTGEYGMQLEDSDDNATHEDIMTDLDTAVATSGPSEATELYANITNDQNRYQFGAQECVSVGDGSYYCQTARGTVPDNDEATFSLLSESGYLNIYIRIGDEVIALTDNLYNDSAPHYDPHSNTVVWHREIDGRYQIISYDLNNRQETQLTTGNENNMQPVRSGDSIVWQRWSGGVWQIVLLHQGIERQLTYSDVHQLAPYINGGYVIWHTAASANKPRQVAVYEIETGLLSTIDDPEGGRVMNPRFVLVYDTAFDNGDILTKGFDPASGEVVPLSAMPRTPPPQIPRSDPVGETRALINNKTVNNKEDQLELGLDLIASTSDNNTDNASTTINASASSTLDLSSPSPTIPLGENDLVIEPYLNVTEPTSNGTGTVGSSTPATY